MGEFEVTAEEANELLNETDDALEHMDDPYIQGVKDALGWVLGHYERPEV